MIGSLLLSLLAAQATFQSSLPGFPPNREDIVCNGPFAFFLKPTDKDLDLAARTTLDIYISCYKTRGGFSFHFVAQSDIAAGTQKRRAEAMRWIRKAGRYLHDHGVDPDGKPVVDLDAKKIADGTSLIAILTEGPQRPSSR